MLPCTMALFSSGVPCRRFSAANLGMMILGPDGHFVQVLTRPGLPKFAAENRLQGTPDENKAIVQGSIALYGSYSVVEKTLVLHVESGTWPAWTGTEQKRPITPYTGNEMSWTPRRRWPGQTSQRSDAASRR